MLTEPISLFDAWRTLRKGTKKSRTKRNVKNENWLREKLIYRISDNKFNSLLFLLRQRHRQKISSLFVVVLHFHMSYKLLQLRTLSLPSHRRKGSAAAAHYWWSRRGVKHQIATIGFGWNSSIQRGRKKGRMMNKFELIQCLELQVNLKRRRSLSAARWNPLGLGYIRSLSKDRTELIAYN